MEPFEYEGIVEFVDGTSLIVTIKDETDREQWIDKAAEAITFRTSLQMYVDDETIIINPNNVKKIRIREPRSF